MKFELITLSGVKHSEEVTEVALKTASGDIAVLPTHEPLTTIVLPGAVKVRNASGKFDTYVTFGGLLEVSAQSCVLLADEAEHIDDLIEKEIEQALAKAHDMKLLSSSKVELENAQTLIDRHTVRLNVAQLNRRGGSHDS
jgi:F-type H+-transporting ATPase subunit epsilon